MAGESSVKLHKGWMRATKIKIVKENLIVAFLFLWCTTEPVCHVGGFRKGLCYYHQNCKRERQTPNDGNRPLFGIPSVMRYFHYLNF